MAETSRAALDVLRADEDIAWVATQLIASFTEGISDSATESWAVDEPAAQSLTLREKTKRAKYETSRPFDEHEKLSLIRFALREVFVTLPAMQRAAAGALKNL